jgi:hypothetical protein
MSDNSNIHSGPRWSYACSCGDELWNGMRDLCERFQTVHKTHRVSLTDHFWLDQGVRREIINLGQFPEARG